MTTSFEPVRKSVEVALPPAEAFRVFTDRIDDWWPLTSHAVDPEDACSCLFEAHEGGRIYETCDDGAVHPWGTVTTWDPPHRLVFTWHPGRDATTAQEVELVFAATDGGTRVTLEHRRWETLGAQAEATREGYDQGWTPVLERYAACCEGP